MQPKNETRMLNFRRANRKMPRCRIKVPLEDINYLNVDTLKKFTTEGGKILPRKATGTPAKIHRKITREIKKARAINAM